MSTVSNQAAAPAAAQPQVQASTQQPSAVAQGLAGTPSTAQSAAAPAPAPAAQDGYCRTWFKTQWENVSCFFGSIKDVFVNTLRLVWGIFTGCCQTKCSRAQAQPAPAAPAPAPAATTPAAPAAPAAQASAAPLAQAVLPGSASDDEGSQS